MPRRMARGSPSAHSLPWGSTERGASEPCAAEPDPQRSPTRAWRCPLTIDDDDRVSGYGTSDVRLDRVLEHELRGTFLRPAELATEFRQPTGRRGSTERPGRFGVRRIVVPKLGARDLESRNGTRIADKLDERLSACPDIAAILPIDHDAAAHNLDQIVKWTEPAAAGLRGLRSGLLLHCHLRSPSLNTVERARYEKYWRTLRRHRQRIQDAVRKWRRMRAATRRVTEASFGKVPTTFAPRSPACKLNQATSR